MHLVITRPSKCACECMGVMESNSLPCGELPKLSQVDDRWSLMSPDDDDEANAFTVRFPRTDLCMMEQRRREGYKSCVCEGEGKVNNS